MKLGNLTTSLVAIAIIGGVIAIVAPATQAQPAYGSYIGAGVSFGLTEGNVNAGESRNTSIVAAIRYKFLEMPVSLRTQVLIGSSTAIVPTFSYDFPINFDTDVYIGAGISLANTSNNTPVGDRNAFILQPGFDYTVPNSNLVVFGNVILAIDGYRNSVGTATALQTGVGFRF